MSFCLGFMETLGFDHSGDVNGAAPLPGSLQCLPHQGPPLPHFVSYFLFIF